MKLIVATSSPGKLRELKSLLPADLKLIPMTSLGIASPDETGQSFLDNAVLKAQHAAMYGLPAIADDSGLEVECLNGAPGVLSARFAGPDASDEDNNALLMRELRRVSSHDRRARFRCAVALALPQGSYLTATGTLNGIIIDAPRGSCGFGYDPYFEIQDEQAPEHSGNTLAEVSLNDKNTVSHRARAYETLIIECSENADLHPLFARLGAHDPPGGHHP